MTQQTERELFEEHIRSLDYYPADAYKYEADCDEYSHPSINNAYSEWKSYRQPLIEEIYMLKSTIAQQGEALEAAKDLVKDGERFRAIAGFDRTVWTNQWLVQVSGAIGEGKDKSPFAIHEYFNIDKLPDPSAVKVVHASKIDALRSAVDQAALISQKVEG